MRSEPLALTKTLCCFKNSRRLSRIASTDKHVTIIDEPSADTDNATLPKETDTPEDKGKEEESKKELAKILMQFDPLVEAEAVDGMSTVIPDQNGLVNTNRYIPPCPNYVHSLDTYLL